MKHAIMYCGLGIIILLQSIAILIKQDKYDRLLDLIECYDRVVDTIDDDYFLDVICTTDEWRDLQNCVERNHLGCGCPKDIMPIDSPEQD